MILPNINSIEDVSDERVESLAEFAQNLSTQNDEIIQTVGSSSILDPNVQRILKSEDALRLLADDPSQDAILDSFSPTGGDESFGLLSFPEDDSFLGGLLSGIKGLFTGLRRKVRRIFCQVVTALGSDRDLDLKQIIKDVLIALIPALAASAGLLPVALPIVVSLAAMLIKHGVSKVCPG